MQCTHYLYLEELIVEIFFARVYYEIEIIN